MNYSLVIYLIINFVVGCLILYLFTKTKYLNFMINPSNRFYKHNFKTYINNHNNIQEQNKFIHKNIDKINQSKESIFQKTKSKAIISHKSVFYKLYILIGILILSTIISYFLFFKYEYDAQFLHGIFLLIVLIICLLYLIRFLFYCFVDVYFFASWICLLFSIFSTITWGVYFACLYCLEYRLLIDNFVSSPLLIIILRYFLLLFVLLPFLISFIVIFFISYLYRANKIKVNTKFHNWLKKLFVISFFSSTSFLSYILNSTNLSALLFGLSEALFYLILYSLVWINTLNQLDRFIEQEIPKKCEWLLVCFLFEAFVMIFLSILKIIIRIVDYFVGK